MSLSVELYGSPVLRSQSDPLSKVTRETRRFADTMKSAMEEEGGIGLAAPQVGRNIRLIIIDTRSEDELPAAMLSEGERLLAPMMPLALVNPCVSPVGEDTSRYVEGCLSIPEIEGEVVRPVRVRLQATLDDGTAVDVECGRLLARCLQHEIDHLDGVLFVDRMNALDRVRAGPKLMALKSRNRRVPAEV